MLESWLQKSILLCCCLTHKLLVVVGQSQSLKTGRSLLRLHFRLQNPVNKVENTNVQPNGKEFTDYNDH